MKKFSKTLIILLVVIFVAATASKVGASTFQLVDENSTVLIDTESVMGMHEWMVDGTLHLYQQWFWYREGDLNHEVSIDHLPIAAEGAFDSDFDGLPDSLTVIYNDGLGLGIEVKYSLSGGSIGSNTSDVAEQIKIMNTSGTTKDFHFFQYTDFDINGLGSDDVTKRVNSQTMQQNDASGLGVVFSETVVTPPPNHWEIAAYPYTYTHLEDGLPSTLSDATSPLGPADLTFAWQWDLTIPENGTVIISKDKLISESTVPEPASMLLLLSGLLSLVGIRRKKVF